MATNNLKGSETLPQGLQTIDGHQLDVRESFTYHTGVRDSEGFSTIESVPFLSANIVGCDVILGRMLLDVVNPRINWETNRFSIRPDGGQVFEIPLRVGRPEQLKIEDTNNEDWEELSKVHGRLFYT